jgi:hypothetical protein
MAIAEGFCRLGRIGFDKATIRVRQIHAKVMEAHLLACNVTIGFAKVRLGMPRAMAQRHEHLAAAQRCFGYVLPHNRICGVNVTLDQAYVSNCRKERMPCDFFISVRLRNSVAATMQAPSK